MTLRKPDYQAFISRKKLIRVLSQKKTNARASLKSKFIHRRERALGKIAVLNDLLTELGARRPSEVSQ